MNKKKDQHIVIPLEIEALSPLHIGSGESISAMGEYLPTSSKVLFPNATKLMEAIRNKGKIQEYVATILSKSEATKTFELLAAWDIDRDEYGIERELNLSRKLDITGQNDILHLHIKTGDNPVACNKIYLPGSSLKGAIRNALIYHYLTSDKSLLNDIKRKLKDVLAAEPHESKKCKRNLLQTWEQFEKKYLISTHWAHALRVSDSESVEDTDCSVVQVFRRTFAFTETAGLDYLLECMSENAVLITKLTIYTPNLNYDKKYGIDWAGIHYLFSAINAFSLANLVFEKEQIQHSSLEAQCKANLLSQIENLITDTKASDDEYAILRIGKGKTRLFQTVLLAFDESLMLAILDVFRKADDEPLPQSRVLSAEKDQMLGWVKILVEQPKPPSADELKVNEVLEVKANETVLDAYYLELKKAELHLNGVVYQVQMTNKFKKEMEVYAPIKVVVKQIKNNGEINQVELIV